MFNQAFGAMLMIHLVCRTNLRALMRSIDHSHLATNVQEILWYETRYDKTRFVTRIVIKHM